MLVIIKMYWCIEIYILMCSLSLNTMLSIALMCDIKIVIIQHNLHKNTVNVGLWKLEIFNKYLDY